MQNYSTRARELVLASVLAAYPDEDAVGTLRDVGDAEPGAKTPEGMSVVEIPLHALLDSDPPTDDDLKAFFDVVLDPARRPVFVHCARGKDRTGTMCAVYRMEVHGWTAERAFEEMRSLGFHTIYGDLERFVRSYAPRGFGKR